MSLNSATKSLSIGNSTRQGHQCDYIDTVT